MLILLLLESHNVAIYMLSMVNLSFVFMLDGNHIASLQNPIIKSALIVCISRLVCCTQNSFTHKMKTPLSHQDNV